MNLTLRNIFFILLIILLFYPLLMNIYDGYLKIPNDSTIYKINCNNLSNDLSYDISNIISVIKSYGSKIDSKNNYDSAEGYKATRSVFEKKWPHVCHKIDKHVKELIKESCKVTEKKLFIPDCKDEKYCWFMRLYNEDGHFLD